MNYISDESVIGKNVKIGHGTVIEDYVTIGNYVRIGHNVTILENTHIGDYTLIGNNVVLGERLANYYDDPGGYENPKLQIGKKCIIRSGSILYAGSKFGDFFQTGCSVSIRERNSFGKGCMFGTLCQSECDVIVGNFTRIINAVEIGKKAKIGNYVWIFAFAILTDDPHPPCGRCKGAATIEDYVIIGPHVILMPNIRIGEGAIVGAGSIVTKDMPAEQVILGTPAKPIKSIYDLRCTVIKDGKPLVEHPYPWVNNLTEDKIKRYKYEFDNKVGD